MFIPEYFELKELLTMAENNTLMSRVRAYNQAVVKLRAIAKERSDAQAKAADLVIPETLAQAEVNKSRDALLRHAEGFTLKAS